MLGLGTPELIVILVILVLLFGAAKLPQLARSIGTSAKELRKGLNGEDDEQSTNKSTSNKASKEA